MLLQPLTRQDIVELQENPDNFIAKHPERVVVLMEPESKSLEAENQNYVVDKIVVEVR